MWKHKERDLNENLGKQDLHSSAFQWIFHTATTRVQYVLSFPQKSEKENEEETEHTKLKRDVTDILVIQNQIKIPSTRLFSWQKIYSSFSQMDKDYLEHYYLT